MDKRFRGHIAHTFRRVPIKYNREKIARFVVGNFDELQSSIRADRCRLSLEQKKDRLLVRELIELVLKGNGFWPQSYNLSDPSRYYTKLFTVDNKYKLRYKMCIRVSDHLDRGKPPPEWADLPARYTIYYNSVDNSDDSIHVAVKKAIRHSLF